MPMFPVATMEEALDALQKAFACEAAVQDATESLYHEIVAVNDTCHRAIETGHVRVR